MEEISLNSNKDKIIFKKNIKAYYVASRKDAKNISEQKSFAILVISKLFLCYGLDIETSRISFAKTIILWVFRIFSMFAWTMIIILKICSYREHDDIKIVFSAILRRTLELSGILLWCVLFHSHKRISSLIQDIQKLAQVSKAFPTRMFQCGIFAWLILVEISLTYSRYYTRTEKCFMMFLKPVIPNDAKDDVEDSTLLFIFLNAVSTLFAYTFPCCFVVLYILLCKCMENVLLMYGKKQLTAISQDINHDLLYKNIKIYTTILSVLHELEKTLSFPVFIVFSFNSLGIFA